MILSCVNSPLPFSDILKRETNVLTCYTLVRMMKPLLNGGIFLRKNLLPGITKSYL